MLMYQSNMSQFPYAYKVDGLCEEWEQYQKSFAFANSVNLHLDCAASYWQIYPQICSWLMNVIATKLELSPLITQI